MQPDQQDNVWVSREEYERLKAQAQLQAQESTAQVSPQQTVGVVAYQVDEPPKVKSMQKTIGVLLAVGLLLSITVPLFKLLAVPILVILLIFAVMGLNDFRKAKQRATAGAASQNTNTQVVGQRQENRKYKTLMIVLLCILAAPVVAIAGLLVLGIVLLAFVHSSGASC